MGVSSDYFLLYHGIHFEESETKFTVMLSSSAKEQTPDEEKIKHFALFLLISRKTFTAFSSLHSFSSLSETEKIPVPKDLKDLYALQYAIIKVLDEYNNETAYDTLHKTFEVLLSEGLLAKENYKKLMSLFHYQGLETKSKKVLSRFSFLEEKKYLIKSLDSLETLTGEGEKLEEIRIFLNDQKFSVGITGVMNAGKSTMINALMGKEILGTSVIPETANLTLLQYAKEASASVFYWNRHEWEEIVASSKHFESMQEFVAQTEYAFQNDLSAYIQEISRRDQISITQLPQYTSATHSQKKCNLVKYVILKTELNYLQEGVEIVDTPGLDDPVIQREEITKQYIARCDMLLHLMNVSQSATQKDIEFIIDAVLYQNITKLLMVITRADTVSQEALDEVILYTKKAIKEVLKVQNKASKLDYILNTIEFIAISGKNALLCRTDPIKAEHLGLIEEDTGILALENYLQENLFGISSKKSQLLIRAGRQKVLKQIKGERTRCENDLILASKSKEELEERFSSFLQEKETFEKKIQSLEEDLQYEKSHLEEYSGALEHFLSSEFYALQTVLRERVVSDVRYAYQTGRKIPQESRIEVIIQTAFKDGIIDIVRDYRYKLSKKFEEIDAQFRIKYGNSAVEVSNVFDAEIFFPQAFSSGFLTQNNRLFIQNIQKVIQRSKAKKLLQMDAEIKEIVKQYFISVELEIREKLNQLTCTFIESFIELLTQPLHLKVLQLKEEKESLQNYIAYFEKEEYREKKSAVQIHEKMKELDNIEADLLKRETYD